MQESTRNEYKRLAQHFYSTRLGDAPPSPKRLQDALRDAAPDYRPAYWRRLRKAIEVDQSDKGYINAAVRIAAVANPVTVEGGGTGDIKPKQRRCRKVTDADIKTIAADADDRGDSTMKHVLFWTRMTGLRPSELPYVQVLDDNRIRIEGAKKSHNGKRGADRDLVVDSRVYRTLSKTVENLPKDAAEVGRLQRRLQSTVNRLFPRRKAKPSLYSIRHQMGSDLKASGKSRAEIATIMGHQTTASVDQYGSRRSGRKGGFLPDASEGNADVRQNHDQPYSQQPHPEPEPEMDIDDDPMIEPGQSPGRDLDV